MMSRHRFGVLPALAVSLVVPAPGWAADGVLPDNDVLMKAMVDELDRSLAELKLEDLARPYYIQYRADDAVYFWIEASYGAIIQSDDRRSRTLSTRVRVGSYELDNTNFRRGGGRASLPLDDDYTALRHAIWRATDRDYKGAIQTLTQKEAYMKDKNVEERPDDYTRGEPVTALEPSAEIPIDVQLWEGRLKRISKRFEKYPAIQDATVRFVGGALNRFIVNSEGTRLRTADTGVQLDINAQIQADDGMRLSDSLSYIGYEVADLPPIERILEDVDKLCERLIVATKSEIPEQYTGPVLFEPAAACRVFDALLADKLCARPIPLGAGRWGDTSLEKKLGLRILPRSFSVYDDPTVRKHDGKALSGAYTYDDEAVPAQRVTIVENGILENLLSGRAPTKKINGSNGHARSGGFGDPYAAVGCLYFSDANGLSADELRQELIQAAKDEGLEYGLRIVSLESGGGGLGNPIAAYKVYVDDGREEPIRGMRFKPIQTRSLKRLLAAGTEVEVYNASSGVGSSIVAPAILFEEIELTRIEGEWDRPPILASPATRK